MKLQQHLQCLLSGTCVYQLQVCHTNLQSMKQLELVKEPLQPCRRKCQRLSSKWFVQSKLKYNRLVIYSKMRVSVIPDIFCTFCYIAILFCYAGVNSLIRVYGDKSRLRVGSRNTRVSVPLQLQLLQL